jgi:hypothetical protein
MSDEQEKKDWRALGRYREGSKPTSRPKNKPSNPPPPKKSPEAQKRDTAAYKRDLDKLFSGGEVPERFRELLGGLAPEVNRKEGSDDEAAAAAAEAAARAEYAARVQGLRDAEAAGFREFVKAVSVFCQAGHALPEDMDLLIRMLDHPAQPVLRAVITHLIAMGERAPLERKSALRARVTTIRSMSDDAQTRKLVDTLLPLLK